MGLFKEGLVNEQTLPSAPCTDPDSTWGMELCRKILRDFLLERSDRWKDSKDHTAKCAIVGNSHRISGKKDSHSLGGEGGQPRRGRFPAVGSAPERVGMSVGGLPSIALSFTLSRRGADGHRLADG